VSWVSATLIYSIFVFDIFYLRFEMIFEGHFKRARLGFLATNMKSRMNKHQIANSKSQILNKLNRYEPRTTDYGLLSFVGILMFLSSAVRLASSYPAST
jgi:hypothetical protein